MKNQVLECRQNFHWLQDRAGWIEKNCLSMLRLYLMIQNLSEKKMWNCLVLLLASPDSEIYNLYHAKNLDSYLSTICVLLFQIAQVANYLSLLFFYRNSDSTVHRQYQERKDRYLASLEFCSPKVLRLK